MTRGEGIAIRSYRVVFDLERRIHKVDRWRVPLPYGLPVRGLAYAACALLVVLIAARLPLIGLVIGDMSPPLRYAVLPGGVAYLLMQLRVDGRPAHATLFAWLRLLVSPSRLVAFRRSTESDSVARLGTVTFAADERSGRYRKSRVVGPTRVMLRYPVEAQERGNTLRLRQTSDRPMWRGKWITIGRRQRLEVR